MFILFIFSSEKYVKEMKIYEKIKTLQKYTYAIIIHTVYR